MWYFAWILGLPLAAGFAVLNAMWYELMNDEALKKQSAGEAIRPKEVPHGST